MATKVCKDGILGAMSLKILCTIIIGLACLQGAESFGVLRNNPMRLFAYRSPSFPWPSWMGSYSYPTPTSPAAETTQSVDDDSKQANQVLNLKLGNSSVDTTPVDNSTEKEGLSTSSMLRDLEKLQSDKNITVSDFVNALPDLDLNMSEQTLPQNLDSKALEEREEFFKGLKRCTFAFANESEYSSASTPVVSSFERYRSANMYMQKYVDCLSNLTQEIPGNASSPFVDIFNTLSDGLYQIFDSLSNVSDASTDQILLHNLSDLGNLSLSFDQSGVGNLSNQENKSTPALDKIQPEMLQEIFPDLSSATENKGKMNNDTEVIQQVQASASDLNTSQKGILSDVGDEIVKLANANNSSAMNKGEIAGIIVGCFIVLAILIVLVGLTVYKRLYTAKHLSSSYENMLVPLGGVYSPQLSPHKTGILEQNKNGKLKGITPLKIPEYNPMTVMDESLVCESSPVQGGLDFNIATDEVSLGEVVGRGAFGVVYKGMWKNKQVAVKVLSLAYGNDEKLLKTFKKEVDILSRLQHSNIVHLYGACFAPPSVFLVEEFIQCGSLHDAIYKKNVRFQYTQLVRIAMDIANALSYLHPKIVHCDLKPQNVLIDDGGHAKVADFGIARFKKGTYMQQTSAATVHGTPAYMSPELFSAGNVTEKCDVYSLGVILWECLARTEPWKELEFPMQVVMAVAVERRRPDIPESCPPSLVRLIKMCWHDNPHRRPSCLEIVKECGFILKELEGK